MLCVLCYCVPEHQGKTLLLSISWQFFKTCGVISYGGGWREDVIDHCLEFALIPCMKFGLPYLGKAGMGIVHENTNFRCSETDFPEKKKMPAGKRNRWHTKKGKRKHQFWFHTKYPQNIRSMFACSYCPSWSCNCEHSHLLLLSRAGNRLEHSHSYTLLRYVSAKKKQMLRKFWKWIWSGGGGGGGELDFGGFFANQFTYLVELQQLQEQHYPFLP